MAGCCGSMQLAGRKEGTQLKARKQGKQLQVFRQCCCYAKHVNKTVVMKGKTVKMNLGLSSQSSCSTLPHRTPASAVAAEADAELSEHMVKSKTSATISVRTYHNEPHLFAQHACVFYGLMTVGAVALAEASDHNSLLMELIDIHHLGVGVLGVIPLLAMLGGFWKWTEVADEVELSQVISRTAMTPILQRQPWWGLLLLSLGAGIGEESLFRGFMQSALVDQLSYTLGPDVALSLALTATTAFFAMLHDYSPLSCMASVFLGLEFAGWGLAPAALTHSLYDLLVMMVIIQVAGGPQDVEREG